MVLITPTLAYLVRLEPFTLYATFELAQNSLQTTQRAESGYLDYLLTATDASGQVNYVTLVLLEGGSMSRLLMLMIRKTTRQMEKKV